MFDIFKSTISVPDDVLMREMAGESVLLNLGSESYFGLDVVGTQMWAALTKSSSVDAAFNLLLTEYAVEPLRLRADLAAFIEKLRQLGLLHVETN